MIVMSRASALDQANVAGARALPESSGELDALPFAKQLEDRTSDGASVKEVFDSALVADEAEP